MAESWDKRTSGEVKALRKATRRPPMSLPSLMKRLGKPSSKLDQLLVWRRIQSAEAAGTCRERGSDSMQWKSVTFFFSGGSVVVGMLVVAWFIVVRVVSFLFIFYKVLNNSMTFFLFDIYK